MGFSVFAQKPRTPHSFHPIEIPIYSSENRERDPFILSIMRPGTISLRVNDIIRVLTEDGYRRKLVVVDARSDSITGRTDTQTLEEVAYQNMIILEKQQTETVQNPWSLFPILRKSHASDPYLTCEQLITQLQRTRVLRNAIDNELMEMKTVVVSGKKETRRQNELLRETESIRDITNTRIKHLEELVRNQGCGPLTEEG